MNPAMAQYVDAYLQTKMTADYPTIPVQYENTESPDTKDTFVQTFFIPGDAFPAAIGQTALKRHPGVYQVNVFTPRDIGGGEGTQLAAAIGEYFQRKNFTLSEGVLRFRDYTVQGRGEINGRYKVEMRIGYQYDENCG